MSTEKTADIRGFFNERSAQIRGTFRVHPRPRFSPYPQPIDKGLGKHYNADKEHT